MACFLLSVSAQISAAGTFTRLRGGGIDLPGGLRYLSEELRPSPPIRRGSPAPQRTTGRLGAADVEASLQHVQTAKAKSILCSEAGFDLFEDDNIILEKNTADLLGGKAASPSAEADDGFPDEDFTPINGYLLRDEAVREEEEEEEFMAELLDGEEVRVEHDRKGRIWHHYDLSGSTPPSRAHAAKSSGGPGAGAGAGLGKRRGKAERGEEEGEESAELERELLSKRPRTTQGAAHSHVEPPPPSAAAASSSDPTAA